MDKKAIEEIINENIKLTGENIKLGYENLVLKKKIKNIRRTDKSNSRQEIISIYCGYDGLVNI